MPKRSMAILFAALSLMQLADAQCLDFDSQPPHLRDIVVKCSIARDPRTKIFTYTYVLSNGRLSTGCVKDFEIDLKYPDSSMELSGEGLADYPRYVDRTAFDVDSSLRTIPVGIPELPSFKGFRSAWLAGFSVRGTVDWIRANKRFNLEPGESLNNIIMTSRGHPGLRSFVVSPTYNPVPPVAITPANEDSVRQNTREPSHEEEVAFEHLVDSIKVRGVTLGPTAPPLTFSALGTLDTLLSYTRQSAELGWLGRSRDNDCDDDERPDDGITKNIEKRLEKAKKELSKRDSTKARKELEKLVDKVERIWKRSQDEENKHKGEQRERKEDVIMTGEAYALLLYNTEYLIDRLPDGKEKKGEKEKKSGDKDDD